MAPAALLGATLLVARIAPAEPPPTTEAAPRAPLLSVASPPTTEAAPRAPLLLVLRARGLDESALREALRLRAGGADVLLLREAQSVGERHAFLDVDASSPPDLTVTVIMGDGRVFVRSAPAPEGARPRDAARLVATVLAAIADETLAPLPERALSPALAREVPLVEVPPAPTVELPPATSPEDPVLTNLPEEPARPPPRPPLRLGLGADFTTGLGLGVPAAPAGLAGLGGGLQVSVRGGRPWLVVLGLRALGRGAGEFALTRLRVSAGAGVHVRKDIFDLRAAASVHIEPWIVSREGRRVRADAGLPAPVLLGGALRLTPAIVPRRVPWLSIGAFAELAASASPTGSAVQIALREPAGDTLLFTFGGLEFSVGLQLDLWLTLRRAARE